ncbi:acyl-CoA-binding domain-containing protein 5A-like isoform X2 [Betta splendens]|uniref:Acyl-CoA-binding domain-containing protein 5 n=1 Tax=Betta splendens TaxID=158456 RepID=A0A6P7L1S3_BETSP|nr:acyl-CoA-binding domain-containing protein 5A-like isoform X2 [Betta splendens]
MAHDEGKHSLEAKFAAAVKVMRSLPEEGAFQPSDYMMLKFYSYYKQATSGPCNISRPSGFWDSYGKAKWDAWSSLGTMTKEEAMKNYVEDIQLILETIPISDEVSELVQHLGNFYTEVNVGEEAEDDDVSRRPFTRPFARAGYGDLWDDIQNLEEKDSIHGISISSEEMEGSREDSEIERKEESSDWRSEEDENGDKEDNTEDEANEDEDEEKECGSDSRLLMVEDTKWTSYTRGPCSSVEPSVSSFTNGTHSSLNSEAEEDELACSPEPGLQRNSYMHLNGHLSDHDDVSEKIYRSTDSDNEEFCDSMEHLAMEECKVQSLEAASVKQRELWFKSSTTLNGGEDQVLIEISTNQHNSSLPRGRRGSPSLGAACSAQLCARAEAQYCCVSPKAQPVSAPRGNVNEQIATTLLRLQRDMGDMLHRLHMLEVLTASQSTSSTPRQEESLPVPRKFLRPSWWPFDCSPLTMMLSALWPLIAHWFVQLCLQRRRRKIP